MPERAPAPDQAARDRIRTDLGTTLFVEAGAGSGKTTALVDRVIALVTSGVSLSNIAAITFTDKAGRELRDRLRHELEARSQGAAFAAALDVLDSAAIGTLHSFAQRILAENPVEAGLPPAVEVLDEVSSGLEFERRWATFRDELLEDAAMERTLLLFFSAGAREDALRVLALVFDDNWDLVEERVSPSSPEPPDVREVVAPAVRLLRSACDRIGECRAERDGMVTRLTELTARLARIEAADTEYDVMELIRDLPASGRSGSKGNWPDLEAIRAQLAAAVGVAESARQAVAEACAKRIGSAIRSFTLATAAERQAAGQLEFHDLLVLARLLAGQPKVRDRLHGRYRYLLLDEFQDTDPIQVELAVRIAGAIGCDPRQPWADIEVRPGHLFVVGDPKQSIYRFRRADISMFLRARDRFGSDAGALVELTANFRSVAPVIDWVNATFGRLMAENDDLGVPSQPDYIDLEPVRAAPPVGPAVAVLAPEAHPFGTKAAELRRREAASVSGAIVEALDEGWEVKDGDGWRRPELGDVTILVPARTSLPFLEDALDAAGIPFRAESSSLVYATRAVRDLLMLVRAIDDPTDTLRTVAALRTPLLGCGDDDLFRFRVERRGHWSFQADQPDTVPADDPVRAGLAYLRSRLADRRWLAPSELMMRIAQERSALELGFAEGRPRDVWRRLRFVIDQARAWSEATGGSLREYLQWVDQQTADGARVAESVLPETDDDAVRIMTIHAAKGLEFPITIVSGLTTGPVNKTAAATVTFPPGGAVGYSFGKAVRTREYEEWAPVDEQMALDERIRLLYVACTRARDHLVVSLHRAARRGNVVPEAKNLTNAELVARAMGEDVLDLPVVGTGAGSRAALVPPLAPPIAEVGAWRAALDAALERRGRPGTVAATALTDEGTPDRAEVVEVDPGLQKRPRDLDLPPWLKGRYGTAVGRAVHGVLQSVDLATADGLDAAVAAQCEAEAIPEREADVTALARAALGSPSIREAAGQPHWREVYACTTVGDRLLEGYVDLLYRTPDGLVVVDHKTAATSDPAELRRRVEDYRTQGASYALTVAAATGEPVSRVTFLFLTPDGAFELDLADLDGAVEDVRLLVVAGREVETA